MTSKQLKPFLEEYLAILFEAAETHGGRVTDSVGDGITAAWTTPTPDPAIAAKACQAALQIDRETQRFSDRHDPLRLPTRIGLNAGWVTLGHVGGAGRFTYTVVGDAVNTASRIEQLNKKLGTRILATKAVVKGVPGLVLRPLGRFRLFGKEEVLEMVEIIRPSGSAHYNRIMPQFEKGLKHFQDGLWTDAHRIFANIASEENDPVSKYFVDLSIHRAKTSISTDRLPTVIRLETK